MALMEYVSLAIALLFENWIWIILTWTLGLLLYVLVPFLTHLMPRVSQRYIMNHHGRQALQTLGRAILVARETSSDHTLTRIKYDGSKGSGVEKFKLAGEERHATDELNLMGRLHGKTFGILDERYGIITDLRLALIGELEHDLNLNGLAEREVTYETQQAYKPDGGEEIQEEEGEETEEGEELVETRTVQRTETAFCDRYALPSISQLVDIRAVEHIMHGSAKPTDINVSYDLAVKSQEGFWSSVGTVEMIHFMMAYAIPFVVTAFMADHFGGGGGGNLADSVTGIAGFIYYLPGMIL